MNSQELLAECRNHQTAIERIERLVTDGPNKKGWKLGNPCHWALSGVAYDPVGNLLRPVSVGSVRVCVVSARPRADDKKREAPLSIEAVFASLQVLPDGRVGWLPESPVDLRLLVAPSIAWGSEYNTRAVTLDEPIRTLVYADLEGENILFYKEDAVQGRRPWFRFPSDQMGRLTADSNAKMAHYLQDGLWVDPWDKSIARPLSNDTSVVLDTSSTTSLSVEPVASWAGEDLDTRDVQLASAALSALVYSWVHAHGDKADPPTQAGNVFPQVRRQLSPERLAAISGPGVDADVDAWVLRKALNADGLCCLSPADGMVSPIGFSGPGGWQYVVDQPNGKPAYVDFEVGGGVTVVAKASYVRKGQMICRLRLAADASLESLPVSLLKHEWQSAAAFLNAQGKLSGDGEFMASFADCVRLHREHSQSSVWAGWIMRSNWRSLTYEEGHVALHDGIVSAALAENTAAYRRSRRRQKARS